MAATSRNLKWQVTTIRWQSSKTKALITSNSRNPLFGKNITKHIQITLASVSIDCPQKLIMNNASNLNTLIQHYSSTYQLKKKKIQSLSLSLSLSLSYIYIYICVCMSVCAHVQRLVLALENSRFSSSIVYAGLSICRHSMSSTFGWYVSLSSDPHTATTIASGGLLIWFLSLSLPPVISSSIYLSFSPTMVINDGLSCGRAKSTLTKKWVKGWRRLERKKK